MKTWMTTWLLNPRPRVAFVAKRRRRQPWPARLQVDYLESRHLPSGGLVGNNLPEVYGQLPLGFEANQGQTDAQVRYLARGAGYALFLTPAEAVLRLHGATDNAVLGLRLLGANPAPAVVGLDALPGHSNYLIGNNSHNRHADIPTYARVAYRGVYSGVDLVYYGNQSQLEYDFLVAPGADLTAIRFQVEGAWEATTDAAGDLVLHAGAGDVVEHAPVLYQEVAGVRQPVSGRFVLEGGGQVGFQVGAFDRSRALVIDPVLAYSTYLGGLGSDAGMGVAVDAAGNAYVTGATASTNFPTTSGALQTTAQGGGDAFVAKLNAAGTQLVYATYLGGSGNDVGTGIAVDAAGSAYVTGSTSSGDFPVTSDAFQTGNHGSNDAFVAKLSADGARLVYASYLGGSGSDVATGIAVDAAGNAYVTGQTSSPDFPTTPGAFQTSRPGVENGFVAKLGADGTALAYATYLGGSSEDGATGIAVDGAGNAYVTGYTASTNFPVTPGAYQASNHGGDDAFAAKLNAAGAQLVYATYLGGLANDEGTAIAVDSAGNAYITGATDSANFPTTLGAFQTRKSGGADAFVAKLSAAGTQLVYGTYLGGSSSDGGTGVAVDAVGNAYVTGYTSSLDFPTTPDAIQRTRRGRQDAFVAKLNATGAALAYATYLGGTGTNIGTAVTVDATGDAYVIGSTDSANFPTTPDAFQTGNHGGQDAFVAKVDTSGPVTHFRLTTSAMTVTAGTILTVTVTALDAYDTPASSYLGTVHFSSSDGAAMLPADYLYTADDHGVHTFAVVLKTAGSKTVTAADTADSNLTDGTMVAVSAAPASHFAVAAPTSTTAGTAFGITVTALDPYGNVSLGYTGTVHFSSTDRAAMLPADYAFTTGDNGVHTFAGITLKTAGNQTLTAADTLDGALTGSGAVAVSAAAASQLTLTAPAGTTAGTAFGVTVTALDPYGNVAVSYTGTVHFRSTDAAAVLPSDYPFTARDRGVHTFAGIVLKTAGARTITAADTTAGSIMGSAAVTVSAAAASHLSVAAPAGATAGAGFGVTVTALDPYGNMALSYTGTVHFTSSDAAAVLPTNYPFTAADGGVHTFAGVILKTAGTRTLTVTDTALGSITGGASVAVSAAAASRFNVAIPAGTTAGAGFSVTITALDPYGNVAPTYAGTVRFTSSDAAAVLPANYPFTAADHGLHTFAGVILKTAGPKTLTATDTAVGSITGGATVSVSAAAASRLSMAAPTGATAGAAFSVTITALDPYDNVAPTYTGTIRFTSSDAAAVLPANYTFTAGDSGSHTFTGVIFKSAGSRTITASDTNTGSLTTNAAITVSAAAASHLGVAAPAGAIAGMSLSITVMVLDPYGNFALSYTGTAHFSSTDAAALLPADYAFIAADHGLHTFASVILKTAGNQTLTATDVATRSLTGSAATAVSAAAASHLTLTAPTDTAAGTAFGITVRALDPYGNVALRYTGTIHLSSSDSTALLPGNYSFTAADAGVHTFNGLTFKKAGRQTVAITDVAGPAPAGTTATVSVSPAAAVTLRVAGFPTPVPAGTPGSGSVTAVDAFGNIAGDYRNTIHFTSSDPHAQLPADYTFTVADAGMHTFTATLTTPGTQSLTVADKANPNLHGDQAGIDVTAVSVVPSIPTRTVLGSLEPAKLGRPVTLTATVTATSPGNNSPTGTVTFLDATTPLGSPVPVVNGAAALTVTTLGLGRHTLTARFTGSGDFQDSTSAPSVQAVHNEAFIAVGGNNGRVQLRRTTDGSLAFDFAPYPGYAGPINVAFGDITGDGFDDLVTAAGAGNPHVKVYNGAAIANGSFSATNLDASLTASFFAYGLNFNVGATVAVGDIDSTGYADLVTGATAGNPHVKIYRGQDIAQGHFQPDGASQVASFFAYGLQFNVGVNVAVGDVTGDGHADLVTGARAGNPHVKVYDGRAFAAGTFNPANADASVLAQWFAFGLQFNIGVQVSVGDVQGTGFGDVITGASAGNPQVKVYDGRAIAQGSLNMITAESHILDQFYADMLDQGIGVTVGASDVENTGRSDILTGATNGAPALKVFRGTAAGISPPALFDLPLTGFPGGISVGG